MMDRLNEIIKAEKKKYYLNAIHALCGWKCVHLKEKFQIRSKGRSNNFIADKIADNTDMRSNSIDLYSEGNFVHCSCSCLNNKQLKDIARIVALSVLS